MEYMCPKCNTIIKFNKEIKKFKCENCKSVFDINQLPHSIKDLKVDYIIPFKIKKEKAVKKYKSLIDNPLLTPRVFKSRSRINRIAGIYVPCYLYSFGTSGVVEFNGNTYSTWKSGGKKYRKTDKYMIMYDSNMDLENIPISCSRIIDNDIELVEPYNFNDLKQFDNSQIESINAYNCDKNREEIIKSIQQKVISSFTQEIKKSIKKYKDLEEIKNSITLNNQKYSIVLLPLWILNINYKNMIYTYLINGQSGKISGTIPINKKRLIFIWIVSFIIILIIMLLINILRVML